MPRARVAIAEDGTLSVWMMGIPRAVPPALLHIDHMGLLLDHLYQDRGGPYEVEVIDPDGSIRTGPVDLRSNIAVGLSQWTGAQQPIAFSPVNPAWGPPAEEALSRQLPADDVAIWEAGFIPGEPVAVAYIAGDMSATADGRLGMALSRQVISELATGEMILFGRQSGTTVVCQLFGPR